MVEFIELEKAAHSQAAMTAAQRGGLSLMERGFCRFQASNWDDQAICAMDGDACLAIVLFKPNPDMQTVDVNLAWVDPGSRTSGLLAGVLQRLRRKFVGGAFTHIMFTYHGGNADMAEAARKLRAEVWTHTARFKL